MADNYDKLSSYLAPLGDKLSEIGNYLEEVIGEDKINLLLEGAKKLDKHTPDFMQFIAMEATGELLLEKMFKPLKAFSKTDEIKYLSSESVIKITETIKTKDISLISQSFKQYANWDISEALDKVPSKLWSKQVDYSRKGDGIRFVSKEHDIRIMQGSKNAEYLTQQQDYVKIVSNGKVIGRDGKVIS